MEHWYKYATLRLCPDKIRGEFVNIGLIIISPKGEIDVRLGANLSKARALDDCLTDEHLNSLVTTIPLFASSAQNLEDKLKMINMSCTDIVRCSAFGQFGINSEKEYGRKIGSLLELLVNPVKTKKAVKVQRISTKMRNLFDGKNLLGGKDDINNHLVVPNFPIDSKNLFKADFALKNGAMHVTQTIDLNTSDTNQKHAQAALDALTLDKARDVFGETTQRYVVFSASAAKSREMEPHIELLNEHATGIYNMESRDDMSSYFELIESAAYADGCI